MGAYRSGFIGEKKINKWIRVNRERRTGVEVVRPNFSQRKEG